MTRDELQTALTSARINWAAIKAAGYSLRAIRDDARAHGDTELARKASRAMAR